MSETFLNNANAINIEDKMNETRDNVDTFNNIVKQTAEKYTAHLDKLMQDTYKMFMNKENDTPTQVIEKYLLELTNLLYFMSDKVEQLSIFADMSKKSLTEAYNNAYLASSRQKDEKGKAITTVAENTAIAENDTMEDAVMASVYASAYKVVKTKVESGYSMVDTLKKVLSNRMQEQTLGIRNKTLLE